MCLCLLFYIFMKARSGGTLVPQKWVFTEMTAHFDETRRLAWGTNDRIKQLSQLVKKCSDDAIPDPFHRKHIPPPWIQKKMVPSVLLHSATTSNGREEKARRWFRMATVFSSRPVKLNYFCCCASKAMNDAKSWDVGWHPALCWEIKVEFSRQIPTNPRILSK